MLISKLYQIVFIKPENRKPAQIDRESKRKKKPICSVIYNSTNPLTDAKLKQKSNTHILFCDRNTLEWCLFFANNGKVVNVESETVNQLNEIINSLNQLKKKPEQLTKAHKEALTIKLTEYHKHHYNRETNKSNKIEKVKATREASPVANKKSTVEELKLVLENKNTKLPFLSLLKAIDRADLIPAISSDAPEIDPITLFIRDSEIIEIFNNVNEEYQFLECNDESNELIIKLYKGLTVYYKYIQNEPISSTEIVEHSYKLLMLFPPAKEGNPFSAIDKFIQSFNYASANNPYQVILEFPLFINQANVSLSKWRNIIANSGKEGLLYFKRAVDIKTKFGHDPADFDEAKKLISQLNYAYADKNPKLAEICEKYYVSEAIFNACLIALEKYPLKTYDNLPNYVIDGKTVSDKYSKYCLVKLPVNDLHALILGIIVNCCQHIGGHSERCVIDGITRLNNGFYILLKSKKLRQNQQPFDTDNTINYKDFDIVGASYAWICKEGDVMVFDSWENLRTSDDPIIHQLLTAFGTKLANEHPNLFQVKIGKGGKTTALFDTITTSEKMAEGYFYGDAKKQANVYYDVEKMQIAIKSISDLLEQKSLHLIINEPYYLYVIRHANDTMLIKQFAKLINQQLKELIAKIISDGLHHTLTIDKYSLLLKCIRNINNPDINYALINQINILALKKFIDEIKREGFNNAVTNPQYDFFLKKYPYFRRLTHLSTLKPEIYHQSNIINLILSLENEELLAKFIDFLNGNYEPYQLSNKIIFFIGNHLEHLGDVSFEQLVQSLQGDIDSQISKAKSYYGIPSKVQEIMVDSYFKLIRQLNVYNEEGLTRVSLDFAKITRTVSASVNEDAIILKEFDYKTLLFYKKLINTFFDIKNLLQGDAHLVEDNYDAIYAIISKLTSALRLLPNDRHSRLLKVPLTLEEYPEEANAIFAFLICEEFLLHNVITGNEVINLYQEIIKLSNLKGFYNIGKQFLFEIIHSYVQPSDLKTEFYEKLYRLSAQLTKEQGDAVSRYLSAINQRTPLSGTELLICINYFIDNEFKISTDYSSVTEFPYSDYDMPSSPRRFFSSDKDEELNPFLDKPDPIDETSPGNRLPSKYSEDIDQLCKLNTIVFIDDAYPLFASNPALTIKLCKIFEIYQSYFSPSELITKIEKALPYLDNILSSVNELQYNQITEPVCFRALLENPSNTEKLSDGFNSLQQAHQLNENSISYLISNADNARQTAQKYIKQSNSKKLGPNFFKRVTPEQPSENENLIPRAGLNE